MEVELDALSGAPNPRWPLPKELEGQVVERLRRLPASRQPVRLREGLGYRGLVLTGTADELGGYDEVVVSGGGVRARRRGELRDLEDRERAFERWLLDALREQMGDAMYSYLIRELNRR